MRRLFFQAFIFITLGFLMIAGPQPAQAEVELRVGEHDGYVRLVFDWKKHVIYNIKKSKDGTLQIDFKSSEVLDDVAVAQGGVPNILDWRILSRAPLSIRMRLSPESRTRHFFAGERFVLDIYDPPGGRKLTKPETVKPGAAQQHKAAHQNPAPPVKANAPGIHKTQKTAMPDKAKLKEPENKTSPHTKGAHHAQSEAKDKPGKEMAHDLSEAEKAQEAEIREGLKGISAIRYARGSSNIVDPALLTVSSTKAVGLAVFTHAGRLWIVTDKPDLLVKPQISGPGGDYFQPLQTMELGDGIAYGTRTRENTHVRAQGGGLLWRVIISGEIPSKTPLLPVRHGVLDGQVRGGKLTWPFEDAGQIIDMVDPETGRLLKIVTVGSSKSFARKPYHFVDFDILPSPVGLVVAPKVDDLEVKITRNGVEISRPGGLALSSQEVIEAALDRKKGDLKQHAARSLQAGGSSVRRIFDFKNWQMGGLEAMEQNRMIILAGLNDLPEGEQVEGIMTLAKMYLSNAHGAEALGFLDLAMLRVPELESHPEFLALRGAARAIDDKSEIAFHDFSVKALEPYGEVNLWRSYVLADLGDWQQATELLPEHFEVVADYPGLLANRVIPTLVEIVLRAGQVEKAEELLGMLHQDKLFPEQYAAYTYLKGEAARQQKKIEDTKEYWEPLLTGVDDLYRAKAGLAYTRLLVNENEITPKKAIDNLERLRYAWRGDELESQIGYWLGRTYFEDSDFIKGLSIMRDAASHAGETDFGKRITAEMTEVFTGVFLGGELEKTSPLDAAALYEQFSELVPAGAQGDRVVERLAERLVQADLLNRAGELLEHQLEHRLEGQDAYRVAVRLSAIHLLNDQAARALESLEKAKRLVRVLPVGERSAKLDEIVLLRARALSQGGRPDKAIGLLNDMEREPDVNKLRAEIAWNAGYWDDAAEALLDVILDENIPLNRELGQKHTGLLLNRAVALNLSSDRIALANMREKYMEAMSRTSQGRLFEVITRPRQSSALADRDTLMSIVSEVDLFGDFLNSYKSGGGS